MFPEILFVLAAAFVWAKLEVEIEGADGWARNLPTWRINRHPLLDIFFGGRPLTGYHLWAFTFVLLIMHFPIAWTPAWSLRQEARLIGYYLIFWVVEDFLWFIVNPHFGWGSFHQQKIWWHKRWFLGLPVDYWIFSLIGCGLVGYSW